MQTIRVLQKTDKDGTLQLRIPLGKPEAEYEVVLVLQPKQAPSKDPTPEKHVWPPGYFEATFGSIDDETFVRPTQDDRILREANINRAALADTAQVVFARLGISCEPLEAEAAQRQMLAEGVRAEDNGFSRDIIEMREE